MTEKRKKTAQILIRTLPKYKTMIEILAQATNMNVSDFMLKESLDGTIEIFHIEELELFFSVLEEIANVQYELNQIGNNINQITRVLNIRNKNEDFSNMESEINSMLELKVQLQDVIKNLHAMTNKNMPIFKEVGKNLRHKEIQCSFYSKEDDEAIKEMESITEEIQSDETLDYQKRLSEIFERVKTKNQKGILSKVQDEGYETFEEIKEELDKSKKEKFDGYQTEVDPENPFSGGII